MSEDVSPYTDARARPFGKYFGKGWISGKDADYLQYGVGVLVRVTAEHGGPLGEQSLVLVRDAVLVKLTTGLMLVSPDLAEDTLALEMEKAKTLSNPEGES